MPTIAAHRRTLTKTIAIAVAALGLAAMSVQPAHAASGSVAAPTTADHGRPAPVPTERPSTLADAPRDPALSCYDYAAEIYDTWGWIEAAGAYVDCVTNPNHPENTDDGASPTGPLGPTGLADAAREPSRSCYDYAYEIYLTSGWYDAASAYLDCYGNPNHPDNDDKP